MLVSGKVVAKNYVDNYQIVGGMRGSRSLMSETTTADIDLHSSLKLHMQKIRLAFSSWLSYLRDDTGKVLVEGFCDDVQPLSKAEEEAVFAYDFLT